MDISMAKAKPKTKEDKKGSLEPKKSIWTPKGKKTATGKAAAEIKISPDIKIMDSRGRPIRESTAVVVWGRMNPPTIGHEHLVNEASNIAKEVGGVPLLFLSKTVGKNNPLTLSERTELVQEAFGDQIFVIEFESSNPINIFKYISETFKDIIVVTGEDQAKDYNRILNDYNGSDFVFESVEVKTVGKREDSSLDLVESMSATKLRKAASENDIVMFAQGVPSKLQGKVTQIFEQVKTGLALYNTQPKSLKDKVLLEMAKQRQSK